MQFNPTPPPSDRLVLLDGRELIAYPCTWKEPSVDDRRVMSLDEFLASYSEQEELQAVADEKAQQRLFIENVFFLYEHREQIMADSRMFLCPVAVEHSIAYSGSSGLHHPVLGVFLEWWGHCQGAFRTGDDGVRSLVYYLAGSPLSGTNRTY